MRAVTWRGRRKVSVDKVPGPLIKEPTDAIIRVTTTNICGSDLHLYEVLGAFMSPGDILGHEALGVVEEVGREADDPLGVASFATHRLALHEAPGAYETFQKKQDGMIKVVLAP